MIMLYFDSTLPYEPWGSFIPLEPQIHFYDLGISETGKKKNALIVMIFLIKGAIVITPN